MQWILATLFGIFVGILPMHLGAQIKAEAPVRAASNRPYALVCESLEHPLGMDAATPRLSWKLRDLRPGALQTAYRLLVSDDEKLLLKNTGNVWDSGRVASNQSVGVSYAGPRLIPSKRYFWRVIVWDQYGRTYPTSDITWWETGLIEPSNWHANWISYEDPEHRAVRAAKASWITNPAEPSYKSKTDSHHDLRLNFDLAQDVASATLYATGEDSVSAWINGQPVLRQSPRPAWGRLPWRSYASTDATIILHRGRNTLAIEALLYGAPGRSQTPINAVLYVGFKDGTSTVLKTGDGDWRSALNAAGEWYQPSTADESWPIAVMYPSVHDAFGGADSLGIPLQTPPVALLRRSFAIDKPIRSARLYATALGAYRMSVNGAQVGDQFLSPGWTDFRQRVTYQVFDVTRFLHVGRNALGASLASGWYATPLEWVGQGNNYGDTPPALKAQLRIEHTDGSVELIATDDSWRADNSPISSAEIYNGEHYDARREQPGWNTVSFHSIGWQPIAIVHPKEPTLVWQSFQPIRATQTLTPKVVSSPAPGTYIYDFGQEFAGVLRIQLSGKRGTDVRMRFGEQLNEDGTLFTANLRNAKATDHYVLAGNGVETYEPSFTFHGFRYGEISGIDSKLPLTSVQGIVLHTDAPDTIQLSTGSTMVNKLWSNILWGQRSNFVGLPTDCPQRDERLGWSADAQVFWRTASYNMDLAAFSRKYAADLRETQNGTAMYGIYAPGTAKPAPGFGPGWSDAGVIVPWTSWIQTGDISIVEQNWDGMKRYVDTIAVSNPDYLWKKDGGISFGDWLAPEGPTSQSLLATAYWAYDASLLRQMAHALGKTDDEQRYARLFEDIRTAFQREYVRPGGIVGAERKEGLLESQTSYVLALSINLLSESDRSLAAARLVDRLRRNNWKLGTGFLGTPYLLEVLSDTGHSDVAYRLLLNTVYPSWGYMVEHGATTMWERWNADQMRDQPGMNSYNHYAYGAVAEWIYRYAAGVDVAGEGAGFHVIKLQPHFDARLGNLKLAYESPYGQIRSSWATDKVGVSWSIALPPNTTGQLAIPSSEISHFTLAGKTLSDAGLQHTTEDKTGQVIFTLPAGQYLIRKPTDRPDAAQERELYVP